MRTRAVPVVALALLLCGGTSGLAESATRATISAHLSRTSFTASQAASVRLTYRFSGTSRRFGYLVTVRAGSAWQTVRRVSRRGSFKGSHTMTVKQFFGARPVRVGRYRITLSADANSVTRAFVVVKPSSGGVVPQVGLWHSTALSGPYNSFGVTVTRLSFNVAADRATVASFAFAYDYNGTPSPGKSCSGSGYSAEGAPSPITNGQFWTPGITGAWSGSGAGTFHGTFDAPTSAHGTAQFGAYVNGPGCMFSASPSTGTFSWTATR